MKRRSQRRHSMPSNSMLNLYMQNLIEDNVQLDTTEVVFDNPVLPAADLICSTLRRSRTSSSVKGEAHSSVTTTRWANSLDYGVDGSSDHHHALPPVPPSRTSRRLSLGAPPPPPPGGGGSRPNDASKPPSMPSRKMSTDRDDETDNNLDEIYPTSAKAPRFPYRRRSMETEIDYGDGGGGGGGGGGDGPTGGGGVSGPRYPYRRGSMEECPSSSSSLPVGVKKNSSSSSSRSVRKKSSSLRVKRIPREGEWDPPRVPSRRSSVDFEGGNQMSYEKKKSTKAAVHDDESKDSLVTEEDSTTTTTAAAAASVQEPLSLTLFPLSVS